MEKRLREALKLLALKGAIVGFGYNNVYIKSEAHRPTVVRILRDIGASDMNVVVVGEVRALSGEVPARTEKFRPLLAGVSVGQRDITAGTVTGFAERNGEAYLVSCAHVLHPWPLSPNPPTNKDVWQPGPFDANYDYSHATDYIVAEYYKHVRVRSMYDYSNCPVTKVINKAYELLRRDSRLIVLQVQNYVDLGAARLLDTVQYESTTYGAKYFGVDTVNPEKHPFFGTIFAGSQYGHGVAVKTAKYWSAYFPELRLTYPSLQFEVEVGDTVAKDGRTSGSSSAAVLDNAASLVVNYGLDTAWFEDVVLTTEDLRVSGGDSGSPVFAI